MTCGALGAIYYGWNALTDKERTQILEKLSSELALGMELIRSLIEFAIRTSRELLDSKQLAAFKDFVKVQAERFGRSLYQVTGQAKDALLGGFEAAGDALSDASETVTRVVRDGAEKVGELAVDATRRVTEVAQQTSEGVGKLTDQAAEAVGRLTRRKQPERVSSDRPALTGDGTEQARKDETAPWLS